MIPHLYIHIPFCEAKCHYCAFYSETSLSESEISHYHTLIAKEFQMRASRSSAVLDITPTTIYMGGGTPSLLGADGFKRLAADLKRHINMDQLSEWSVEINPSSATPALFDVMLEAGVTRITFGVQSFNEPTLRLINRIHSAKKALAVIESAKKSGFNNIGVDLIAGLPGITTALWKQDLQQTLEVGPRHISVYNLTLEPNTRLAQMVDAGLNLPDENTQLDHLREAELLLAKHGFQRYEISNYALQGSECQHNIGIWRGNSYLGLGPAAASRIGRERIENQPDYFNYKDHLQNNEMQPQNIETLSSQDDALERAVFALRLHEGINPANLALKFPPLATRVDEWNKTLHKLCRAGIVEETKSGMRLNERGREVCDSVIREMI